MRAFAGEVNAGLFLLGSEKNVFKED